METSHVSEEFEESGGFRTLDKLDELCRLLSDCRTLAVVGLSTRPTRDSHTVSAYLQARGFRIVGIHPGQEQALGEPCYPSLSAVPDAERDALDLVVVFRRPEHVPDLLDEASSVGLRRIWLQLGVSSPEAEARARHHGMVLVADKCIRVVHSLCSRSEDGDRFRADSAAEGDSSSSTER